MVAVPEPVASPPNRKRLLAVMREVDFPGEPRDHIWMARRLELSARKLNRGVPSDYLEDLLLSGVLMERGFDISASPRLNGRCFPDNWLRAVPGLLKNGCPESSWRLIESGVLRFEGEGFGHARRWRIDGEQLRPHLNEWHELGACLIFQNLARGLFPLIQDAPRQTEIILNGTNRGTGRKWLRELKSALRALGVDPPPHQMVLS